MEKEKSKLILSTFDGTMKKLNLTPKCKDSKVEFKIKYYNDDDVLTKATIIFEQVIAIDFEVYFSDNCDGEGLTGFNEIFETPEKEKMLEKIFNNRLKGYLYHGDYHYDPNEEDMLNDRKPIDEITRSLNDYHLYQQQTRAGIFYVLAAKYQLVINKYC